MSRTLIPHNCGKTFYNYNIGEQTYWKIGGSVFAYIVCDTLGELQNAISFLESHSINWVILGEGSNLLVADGFIDGAVIRLGKSFSQANVSENIIKVGSAKYVPCLAHLACIKGFKGLEHIIGIPGSLGGLIVMNGGSLRQSISQYITSVKVLNEYNEIQTLSTSDCKFGYRDSIFRKSFRTVIVEAEFQFDQFGDSADIRNEMLGILSNRRGKFPKEPSGGSVFKSDENIFQRFGGPGKIVELLGFKGYRIGGAQVSEKHGNFIINLNNCTAGDVLRIIHKLRNEALRIFGVPLEAEVIYLNNECKFETI